MKKIKIIFISLAIIIINCQFIYGSQAQNPYTEKIVCPILTYHDVRLDDSYTNDWTVSAEKFENDIKQLTENGYTPIFTKELVDAFNVKCELPEKPVIIQFDVGYQSFFNIVYPILYKYNVKAEVYIITDYTKDIPYVNNADTFLSWPQLKIMSDSGLVYIGLHGKTHKAVIGSDFTKEKLQNDFAAAWNEIETHLGPQPHYYVYPNGLFNNETLKSLSDSGAQMQFIWVWNLSRNVKNYNILPRANIDKNQDIISSIEYFNNALKIKIK